MEKQKRHEVYTRYGWFSLDAGSYRDYLAGRLWITWPPLKEEPIPPTISKRAVVLRSQAEQYGFPAVAGSLNAQTLYIPYEKNYEKIKADALRLSVKVSNVLIQENIRTLGELRPLLEETPLVPAIRSLGRKGADELKFAFIEYCYKRLPSFEQAKYWQDLLDKNVDL